MFCSNFITPDPVLPFRQKATLVVQFEAANGSVKSRLEVARNGCPRRIAVAVLSCLSFWTMIQTAFCQNGDSFEGGAPRWILVESDCKAQLAEHEISLIMPHSGRTSELMEVSCGQGQLVMLAYPVEPAVALNEFQPELWVRCSAGRIRFGVRVIFPKAIHPVSQSRLTTILWGELYDQPGNWQRLQVKQLADLLQQEIVAIRNHFDVPLDLDQPYVDSLVMNAYTGPGRYRVQVDDLALTGIIPLASTGVPLPVNWRQRWRWREEEGVHFGSAPQFPTWIEHQGEQPAWLQSLGFSGVLLSDVPQPADLKVLREASMQVICPPPDSAQGYTDHEMAAVKGWLVGAALNRGQAEAARVQAAQANSLPDSFKRPLYGEALEQFWLFSRLTNEVIVPAPDPVSAGQVVAKREWLAKSLETVQIRGSGLVSVQLGANPALSEQYRVVSEVLQPEQPANDLANPLGIRYEAIGAVMAGAKGIVFRNQVALNAPIDVQATQDRAIEAALRWTNSDLRLWSPWILVGQKLEPPQLSRKDYLAARWRAKDAELILAQVVTQESQWCLPATRSQPLDLQINDAVDVPQVVRLTEGRVELMAVETKGGDHHWQVSAPNPCEIFVATRNPHILNYVRRRLQARAAEIASDQLEIASYCVDQVAEVLQARQQSGPQLSARPGQADSESGLVNRQQPQLDSQQQRRLVALQNLLQRGWQAMQNQQPAAATRLALETLEQTQSVMHESFMLATSNLATAQASPWILAPSALKYHWQLAQACARSQWQPLPIPGSQFANLQEMLDHGWSQQRRLEDQIDFRVELVPASLDSPGGLRLASYPKTAVSKQQAVPTSQSAQSLQLEAIPGGYEGASLRVRSAGVPARRGQLVRITAQAYVRMASTRDATAGLLIYDNQAGPSLGQLVRGTTGQRVPVELYRFVQADGDFRILAECRGACDIQLENLSASIIRPVSASSAYQTAPIDTQLYPAKTDEELTPPTGQGNFDTVPVESRSASMEQDDKTISPQP